MSGIYGAWQQNKESPATCVQQAVFQLAKAHASYGKDAAACEQLRPGITLGAHINHIPEDCAVPPPVLRAGDDAAVIDALLYNREALAARFTDGRNRDRDSDEELLWETYRTFGAEALATVNGDFAGAVYDSQKNTITLFRDHLGVRPLFYAEENGLLAFATDETALAMLPCFPWALDEESLYLRSSGFNYLHCERTAFQKVKAVLPAHTVSLIPAGNGGFTAQKKAYWRLSAKKIRYPNEQAYIGALRTLTQDAVARRLARTGMIVGAELSGGLDSSVIDVLIHRMGREAVYYSWSPDTDTAPLQENDERGIIALICQQEGIACLYHRRPDDPAAAVARLKENPPTDSYYSIFIEGAERFAEAGARIAFSGWGGDEGVSHRAHLTEMLLHGEPIAYLREVLYRAHGQPIQAVRMLVGHLRFLLNRQKPWNGFQVSGAPVKIGLSREFTTRMEPIVHKEPLWFNTHPIRQIEQGGNRARMELAAREGAQHNVQYVYPYLDYRLEDFAVSIPRWLYNRKGENRYIYRRAFAGIMPEELTRLTDKSDAGRTTPLIGQSSAMLDGISAYALTKLNRDYWRRYLDFDALRDLLAENRLDKLSPYAMLEATQLLTHCCYLQRVMDIRDATEHATKQQLEKEEGNDDKQHTAAQKG